jgi:hypothetical protein
LEDDRLILRIREAKKAKTEYLAAKEEREKITAKKFVKDDVPF